MIGYIGEETGQRKPPVLYEDSRAMLIVKTILMREGHGSGAGWTGVIAVIPAKISMSILTLRDMSAFWQLRTWQRQVI